MKKDKQHQYDSRYMRMAHIWAENSYAIRRKVGALIVKGTSIISDGYNGTPSGFENECEDVTCLLNPVECRNPECHCVKCGSARLTTKPYVLHAEANAITKLARSGNSSDGATIYVTASPCVECAKLIIQSGIKRVVYDEEYRDLSGVELLKRAGVEIERMVCDEK